MTRPEELEVFESVLSETLGRAPTQEETEAFKRGEQVRVLPGPPMPLEERAKDYLAETYARTFDIWCGAQWVQSRGPKIIWWEKVADTLAEDCVPVPGDPFWTLEYTTKVKDLYQARQTSVQGYIRELTSLGDAWPERASNPVNGEDWRAPYGWEAFGAFRFPSARWEAVARYEGGERSP